jgi:hypothetical protein
MNINCRRCTLGLMLLFMVQSLSAQVNIVFNPTAYGRDMRGLSFVQITNNSTRDLTGNMSVDIRSLAGTVARIQLSEISFRRGMSLVPSAKWTSAIVNYSNSDEGNYLRQTGRMPEGELEYCFKIIIRTKDQPEQIYENCFTGTNIISSPLELTSPSNGEVNCSQRPRLSWQPPMPMAPGTLFSVKLVQLQDGQNAAEALLVNTPIVYQPAVAGNTIGFPSNVPELREGMTYAWQVTTGGKGMMSRSEIWKFTVDCAKTSKGEGSYRELKAEDDGGFLVTGSSLRLAVHNPFLAGQLQYTIADLSEKRKALKNLPRIILEKGSNNILIDLHKVPGMKDGNDYLITATLPDGKAVSLRFKYDSSND